MNDDDMMPIKNCGTHEVYGLLHNNSNRNRNPETFITRDPVNFTLAKTVFFTRRVRTTATCSGASAITPRQRRRTGRRQMGVDCTDGEIDS